MNKPLSLQEKRRVYLGILKEIDKFCTQYDIRYYLACGTLIGAVRHKGFIPWDDDLDVFVPEPDFKRFAQLYSSNSFKLVTCYNYDKHPYPFGRLYDNRTCSESDFGVGVDIYIIYGAPSDVNCQKMHQNKVFRYIKRKRFWLKYARCLEKLHLWPFYNVAYKMMNCNIKKAVHEFEKFGFEESEYIWPYGGGKLNLKKEFYGNPVRIPFEDGFYNAPEHYHEVLTAGYGDYMKLPPEEKRQPYHNRKCYWKNK